MREQWSLEELRAHIRGGGDHALLDVVNSIGRAAEIFTYHLFTARDALNGIIDESHPAGFKNLQFVLGASERQDEYAYAKIVNEANVIGCIHAARSIFDIFSHLVNGLLLGSSIPTHVCDIAKAKEALPQSELKDHISSLLASDWYNYVVGFINTTKHRRFVPHQFSVSFESDAAGIKLESFEYNGRQFPAYWGTEVLQGVLAVKNSVVACGRALNRVCISRNA